MQMNRRVTIAGLAVIGVAGLAGTAFAASITGLSTSNAGQGAATIAGYSAGAVSFTGVWTGATNDTSTDVDDAVFLLKKAADGTGASSVTDANTSVYAQLTGGTASNWVTCSVGTSPAAGTVTCDFSGANKPLDEVTGISIVAYDK